MKKNTDHYDALVFYQQSMFNPRKVYGKFVHSH